MNIKPGFSGSVIDALTLKVQAMDPIDRNVALVFDEMSIKQGLVYNEGTDSVEGFEDFGDVGQSRYIANHAIAFMVRGLASKWKQPVGYFLSSGPIKATILRSLTKQCIDKIDKTGLNVVALVCDQGSNNRSFIQHLEKVTIEKPYIMHGNKQVFVFYDPPHLLKNVRNNLKKADLRVGEKIVSWQHIVDFYNIDKMQMIQMAPKLKERHIELPPFSAMRVNLAAQVLSHSVAAGISFLVTAKELPEDAIETAKFVENFDALFNTFNSQKLKSSQRHGNAFRDSSSHHAFLKDSLKFLDSIKTLGDIVLPCIFGWKLCIHALFDLWDYLKTEQNFKFLLTNRLNQDCAENLFSIIRGKGGFRDNPDAVQFKDAFKYIVADKLFVQSGKSNCKVDNDKILLDISSVAMAKYVKPVATNVEKLLTTDVALVIIPPLSIPTKNVAAYLSGYLLRKIPIDNCEECTDQMLLTELPSLYDELSVYEFLRNKTYQEKGCLVYPTLTMVNFVENLENMFCALFEGIVHMPFLLTRLCKSAEEYCQFLTCTEIKCKLRVKNMVKLYIKVRIFHALKRSNAYNTEDKSVKRNRKILKLRHL